MDARSGIKRSLAMICHSRLVQIRSSKQMSPWRKSRTRGSLRQMISIDGTERTRIESAILVGAVKCGRGCGMIKANGPPNRAALPVFGSNINPERNLVRPQMCRPEAKKVHAEKNPPDGAGQGHWPRGKEAAVLSFAGEH